MRIFYLLLTTCCLLLSPACDDGILSGGESPESVKAPPPGGGHWGKISAKRDGHYNVRLTNTSVSCPDEKKSPDIQEMWDFVAYDEKSGWLKFPDTNAFYWYDTELELDDEGKFQKTLKTGAIYFFTYYIGYEMEISGRIADKKIEARINYKYFASENLENDSLKLYCEFAYEVTGFQRYAPKQSASLRLEGEYGAKVKTNMNTCIFDRLPKKFGLDLVWQKNNLINLQMPDFLIAELPLDADGKVDISAETEFDQFTVKGRITPEEAAIELTITYGLYGCRQEYEIYGIKRFEEPAEENYAVDGVYSVNSYLEKNTCDNRSKEARFHLDALMIDDKTARIILGNKDFVAKIDGNNFSALTSSGAGLNTVTNSFTGKITPQKISGALSIKIEYTDFATNLQNKCEFLYQITGQKLYKHN